MCNSGKHVTKREIKMEPQEIATHKKQSDDGNAKANRRNVTI